MKKSVPQPISGAPLSTEWDECYAYERWTHWLLLQHFGDKFEGERFVSAEKNLRLYLLKAKQFEKKSSSDLQQVAQEVLLDEALQAIFAKEEAIFSLDKEEQLRKQVKQVQFPFDQIANGFFIAYLLEILSNKPPNTFVSSLEKQTSYKIQNVVNLDMVLNILKKEFGMQDVIQKLNITAEKLTSEISCVNNLFWTLFQVFKWNHYTFVSKQKFKGKDALIEWSKFCFTNYPIPQTELQDLQLEHSLFTNGTALLYIAHKYVPSAIALNLVNQQPSLSSEEIWKTIFEQLQFHLQIPSLSKSGKITNRILQVYLGICFEKLSKNQGLSVEGEYFSEIIKNKVNFELEKVEYTTTGQQIVEMMDDFQTLLSNTFPEDSPIYSDKQINEMISKASLSKLNKKRIYDLLKQISRKLFRLEWYPNSSNKLPLFSPPDFLQTEAVKVQYDSLVQLQYNYQYSIFTALALKEVVNWQLQRFGSLASQLKLFCETVQDSISKEMNWPFLSKEEEVTDWTLIKELHDMSCNVIIELGKRNGMLEYAKLINYELEERQVTVSELTFRELEQLYQHTQDAIYQKKQEIETQFQKTLLRKSIMEQYMFLCKECSQNIACFVLDLSDSSLDYEGLLQRVNDFDSKFVPEMEKRIKELHHLKKQISTTSSSLISVEELELFLEDVKLLRQSKQSNLNYWKQQLQLSNEYSKQSAEVLHFFLQFVSLFSQYWKQILSTHSLSQFVTNQQEQKLLMEQFNSLKKQLQTKLLILEQQLPSLEQQIEQKQCISIRMDMLQSIGTLLQETVVYFSESIWVDKSIKEVLLIVEHVKSQSVEIDAKCKLLYQTMTNSSELSKQFHSKETEQQLEYLITVVISLLTQIHTLSSRVVMGNAMEVLFYESISQEVTVMIQSIFKTIQLCMEMNIQQAMNKVKEAFGFEQVVFKKEESIFKSIHSLHNKSSPQQHSFKVTHLNDWIALAMNLEKSKIEQEEYLFLLERFGDLSKRNQSKQSMEQSIQQFETELHQHCLQTLVENQLQIPIEKSIALELLQSKCKTLETKMKSFQFGNNLQQNTKQLCLWNASNHHLITFYQFVQSQFSTNNEELNWITISKSYQSIQHSLQLLNTQLQHAWEEFIEQRQQLQEYQCCVKELITNMKLVRSKGMECIAHCFSNQTSFQEEMNEILKLAKQMSKQREVLLTFQDQQQQQYQSYCNEVFELTTVFMKDAMSSVECWTLFQTVQQLFLKWQQKTQVFVEQWIQQQQQFILDYWQQGQEIHHMEIMIPFIREKQEQVEQTCQEIPLLIKCCQVAQLSTSQIETLHVKIEQTKQELQTIQQQLEEWNHWMQMVTLEIQRLKMLLEWMQERQSSIIMNQQQETANNESKEIKYFHGRMGYYSLLLSEYEDLKVIKEMVQNQSLLQHVTFFSIPSHMETNHQPLLANVLTKCIELKDDYQKHIQIANKCIQSFMNQLEKLLVLSKEYSQIVDAYKQVSTQCWNLLEKETKQLEHSSLHADFLLNEKKLEKQIQPLYNHCFAIASKYESHFVECIPMELLTLKQNRFETQLQQIQTKKQLSSTISTNNNTQMIYQKRREEILEKVEPLQQECKQWFDKAFAVETLLSSLRNLSDTQDLLKVLLKYKEQESIIYGKLIQLSSYYSEYLLLFSSSSSTVITVQSKELQVEYFALQQKWLEWIQQSNQIVKQLEEKLEQFLMIEEWKQEFIEQTQHLEKWLRTMLERVNHSLQIGEVNSKLKLQIFERKMNHFEFLTQSKAILLQRIKTILQQNIQSDSISIVNKLEISWKQLEDLLQEKKKQWEAMTLKLDQKRSEYETMNQQFLQWNQFLTTNRQFILNAMNNEEVISNLLPTIQQQLPTFLQIHNQLQHYGGMMNKTMENDWNTFLFLIDRLESKLKEEALTKQKQIAKLELIQNNCQNWIQQMTQHYYAMQSLVNEFDLLDQNHSNTQQLLQQIIQGYLHMKQILAQYSQFVMEHSLLQVTNEHCQKLEQVAYTYFSEFSIWFDALIAKYELKRKYENVLSVYFSFYNYLQTWTQKQTLVLEQQQQQQLSPWHHLQMKQFFLERNPMHQLYQHVSMLWSKLCNFGLVLHVELKTPVDLFASIENLDKQFARQAHKWEALQEQHQTMLFLRKEWVQTIQSTCFVTRFHSSLFDFVQHEEMQWNLEQVETKSMEYKKNQHKSIQLIQMLEQVYHQNNGFYSQQQQQSHSSSSPLWIHIKEMETIVQQSCVASHSVLVLIQNWMNSYEKSSTLLHSHKMQFKQSKEMSKKWNHFLSNYRIVKLASLTWKQTDQPLQLQCKEWEDLLQQWDQFYLQQLTRNEEEEEETKECYSIPTKQQVNASLSEWWIQQWCKDFLSDSQELLTEFSTCSPLQQQQMILDYLLYYSISVKEYSSLPIVLSTSQQDSLQQVLQQWAHQIHPPLFDYILSQGKQQQQQMQLKYITSKLQSWEQSIQSEGVLLEIEMYSNGIQTNLSKQFDEKWLQCLSVLSELSNRIKLKKSSTQQQQQQYGLPISMNESTNKTKLIELIQLISSHYCQLMLESKCNEYQWSDLLTMMESISMDKNSYQMKVLQLLENMLHGIKVMENRIQKKNKKWEDWTIQSKMIEETLQMKFTNAMQWLQQSMEPMHLPMQEEISLVKKSLLYDTTVAQVALQFSKKLLHSSSSTTTSSKQTISKSSFDTQSNLNILELLTKEIVLFTTAFDMMEDVPLLHVHYAQQFVQQWYPLLQMNTVNTITTNSSTMEQYQETVLKQFYETEAIELIQQMNHEMDSNSWFDAQLNLYWIEMIQFKHSYHVKKMNQWIPNTNLKQWIQTQMEQWIQPLQQNDPNALQLANQLYSNQMEQLEQVSQMESMEWKLECFAQDVESIQTLFTNQVIQYSQNNNQTIAKSTMISLQTCNELLESLQFKYQQLESNEKAKEMMEQLTSQFTKQNELVQQSVNDCLSKIMGYNDLMYWLDVHLEIIKEGCYIWNRNAIHLEELQFMKQKVEQIEEEYQQYSKNEIFEQILSALEQSITSTQFVFEELLLKFFYEEFAEAPQLRQLWNRAELVIHGKWEELNHLIEEKELILSQMKSIAPMPCSTITMLSTTFGHFAHLNLNNKRGELLLMDHLTFMLTSLGLPLENMSNMIQYLTSNQSTMTYQQFKESILTATTVIERLTSVTNQEEFEKRFVRAVEDVNISKKRQKDLITWENFVEWFGIKLSASQLKFLYKLVRFGRNGIDLPLFCKILYNE